MSADFDDLSAARQRIAAAYDPCLLEEAGHLLSGLLAGHLAEAQRCEGPVLPWADPPDAIRDAVAVLHGSTPAGASGGTAETFGRLVQLMLDRGLNLHDPRYIGHQVPASLPLAGLFDAVGSVTNQCPTIYEMGPWATAAERAMVAELGQLIGWAPDSFAGAVTHGGSLANLTGLLTARNVALGDSWEQGLGSTDTASVSIAPESPATAELSALAHGAPPPGTRSTPQTDAAAHPVGAHARLPVLVAHADAHYSVARAAGILGLGSRQIVRVGLDERGRMDPQQLDAELARLRFEGRPVVAVVACACATPTGAFDRLADIAAVCRHHEVWLHVDAAHGGAALLSERHRHLLAGLELADSVVWDAHKMLFVPALCAFVLYRDRARAFDAFHQDAPYLFDPAAPGLAEYDTALRTVECSKRAAAFGLWGVWSLFGRQLFADMVDVTFALGRIFHEKLVEADDFVPLHEPECNIVVFRHIPGALRDAPPERVGGFQLELRRRLIESGEFYIVPSKHHGVGALRVTLSNPLTTPGHLDQLMEALRHHGREMLRD